MIIDELDTLTYVIIAMYLIALFVLLNSLDFYRFVAAVVLLLLASAVFFMPVVNNIFEYKVKTFCIHIPYSPHYLLGFDILRCFHSYPKLSCQAHGEKENIHFRKRDQ